MNTKPSPSNSSVRLRYPVEDVLPSFEMHNHMFNRSIHDLSAPLHQPPGYLESSDRTDSAQSMETVHTPTILDPSTLLLNNLTKIKKVQIPLRVQVVITSETPKIQTVNERANPLKQYKPSETVEGYIIIENKSNLPIPFEMILVSLEGEETVAVDNPKTYFTKKVNQFLKSYDLSACYHDGVINAGITRDITHALQKDTVDETYFGFNPDKVIFPKTKHKKFFMFKIPNYLLDTACEHQIPQHLATPPSFGCDNRAFSGKANQIENNPLLGYGRLDDYGSPLKTNDMAVNGQSISYFLHVQIIGKNEGDSYAPFLANQKATEGEILIVEDFKYYIRVDTSSEQPLYEEEDYNQFHPSSTYQQIQYVQHLVEEELNSVLERKNLLGIGISNRREQDEIINRNLSSTKKDLSSSSQSLLVPVVSGQTSPILEDGYSSTVNIKFVKDFFNKVDGEMMIKFKMDREAQMKSVLPKALAIISQKDLKEIKLQQHQQPQQPLQQHPLTSTSSSLSLKSMSSSTVLQCQDVGEIELSLTFTPKKSKSILPSSISITPNLVAYTIQSGTAIPITFDNRYMSDNGIEKVKKLSSKFKLYKNQMVTTAKDINIGLQRQVLNIASSLSDLKISTSTIRKIFAQEQVTLSWVENVMTGNYECNLRFKVAIDNKAAHKAENQLYGIIPSFQSCHIVRGYLLEIEIGYRKGKPKQVVYFPVIVD